MKGQISIALLCHILVNLQLPRGNTAAPDNSGERVHIRLHMPEVVRQHTHLHKVYKHQPPPLKKLLPVAPPGKPHVSLLGYTTMAGGTGKMAPSLMQLMASVAPNMAAAAAAPAMTPNYGPALFESYNQDTKDATAATTASGSSFLATAPATAPATGSVTTKQQQQHKQQQMLQQLLKPNIIAAITAAAAEQQEQVPELEPEPESELEQNELLNGHFLAALQQELISKFGYEDHKRKKVSPTNNYRRPQKQQKRKKQKKQHFKYIQDLQSHEQFDDYNEEPTSGFEDYSSEPYEGRQSSWRHHGEPEDEARVYDSAAAFSGQKNAIFPMDVDEFLHDVSDSSSYPSYNGNFYDDYDPSDMAHNSWQTTTPAFKSYARPTKPTTATSWRTRSRRPFGEFNSGSGTGSGSSSGKARYIRLTKHKKRKNRIKSNRYI